jgi:hypothetical protein
MKQMGRECMTHASNVKEIMEKDTKKKARKDDKIKRKPKMYTTQERTVVV